MEREPVPRIEVDENVFFDPAPPPVPEHTFGLESRQLLDIAQTAGSVALALPYNRNTYPVTRHGYALKYISEDVLRVVPLVERVYAGEQLQIEDVRPYRKSLKDIMRHSGSAQGRRLGYIDRLFSVLSVVGIGIPLRRKLNRRIEEEFIARAPGLVEEAMSFIDEHIDQAAPYIETLAGYDNPQQEIREEFYGLNSKIKTGAREIAGRRGVAPSSEDVASSIKREIKRAKKNPEELAQRMPLLSRLLPFKRISKTPNVSSDILGVAAPEIMEGLDRLSPEERRDPKFVRNIHRRPHPKRGLALRFKRRQMEDLHDVTVRLVPKIIEMVPNRGRDVQSIFNKVKALARDYKL